MKRILFLALSLLMLFGLLSGCGNRQLIDVTYTFDEAIIRLPDGAIVRGKIDSWKDYGDGDQLQVKIDGVTYLVHATDCALIHN